MDSILRQRKRHPLSGHSLTSDGEQPPAAQTGAGRHDDFGQKRPGILKSMRWVDVLELGAPKVRPKPFPDVGAGKPARELAFLAVELEAPKQLEMRRQRGRGEVVPGRH